MRVRVETLKRYLAMACVPVVVFSAFALKPAPVMAQSGCPVTPTYDTLPNPLTGIINTYYPGCPDSPGTVAAGATSVTVGTPAGAATLMAVGNLALVIQMQDGDIDDSNTDSYGNGVGGGTASGSSMIDSAGLYEYVRITAISGGVNNHTFTFQGTGTGGGLLNSYRASLADSTAGGHGQYSFQVIRVPQYLNATVGAALTAKPWGGPLLINSGNDRNGMTGGVLAFDVAGTLTLASQTINVSGRGFRGGGGRQLQGQAGGADTDYRTAASYAANGSKGEGISGTPRYVWDTSLAMPALTDYVSEGYPSGSYARGAPGNAGGGGTDGNPEGASPNGNDENSGGGGGGNCGTGGQGGNTWQSNLALRGGYGGFGYSGSISNTRVFMGGGGGAGTTNNGSQSGGPDPGNGQYSSGAAGGGIVMIRANIVSGTGTINANGANAPFNTGRDGAGGGGAGGTVLVAIRAGVLSGLTVTANGGRGGDAWPLQDPNGNPGERHGPGGGGGGGAIRTSGPILSASVAAGAHGITTTSNNNAYGSTNGTSGCTSPLYLIPNVPGVSSGGECNNPTSVELVSLTALKYDNGVLLTWRTASEQGNLGFQIYREQDGVRLNLTPQMVAGSALKTSARLLAGHSYSWWDPNGTTDTRYWIEDVGFTGKGTLYGPYSTYPATGTSPVTSSSPALGREAAQNSASSTMLWPSGDSSSLISRTTSAKGSPPPPPGGAGGSSFATQWAIANRPALKLAIRELGWYRVTADELSASGLDITKFDARSIRLYADGTELPILVTGEADGRLDPGDAVEFFATGVSQPTTDTRVYYLTAGDGIGKRIKLAAGPAGPSNRVSFPATAELRERVTHFAGLSNGDAENFFGQVIASDPVDQALDLPNLDPAGSTATVEVALQGVTFVPHRVTVSVNGTPVGEGDFTSREAATLRYTVPVSALHAGSNTVTLSRAGGSDDVTVIDTVRITYPHLPSADGDRLLVTTPGSRTALTFGGFSQSGARVVNVTNPLAVQELAGVETHVPGAYEISVQSPVTSSRLLAFTPDQIRHPVAITLNRPSTWNATSNRADAVFITHSSFAQSIAPLVALRQSQGFSTAVVDIDDVYDEFGFGYHNPYAIREFLRRAETSWTVKPRYVVLVGDASFDPRNYFGLGGEYVPTKTIDTSVFETYSDDWFADFNNDDLPELAVGRLPVNSPEQAAAVVAKIVSYESATPAPPRRGLVVADTNDIYDFEAAGNRMAGLFGDATVLEIRRSTLGDSQARQQVLSALSAGQDTVYYSGHGGIDLWRGNLFTSGDAVSLTNSSRLSVAVLSNCLNGYYTVPTLPSVGEALVQAPAGGAVLVWASSGDTEPTSQEILAQTFFNALYGGSPVTAGQAARLAKAAVNGDVRRTWILLGDPMTRVR